MSFIDVLIKAELISDIKKPKFSCLFAPICWILNFLDAHIHPLFPHHLKSFLSHSVCARAHFSGHSFFHNLKFSEPFSSRKSRRSNRSAHENPAICSDLRATFTFTLRKTITCFQPCNFTIMLDISMHALPRRIYIFAFIVNLLSFFGYLNKHFRPLCFLAYLPCYR